MPWLMRCAAVGAVVLAPALPGEAAAQGRPDLRRLTCASAQALIDERGMVTLSTGDFTYEQFVAGNRFCGRLAAAAQRLVATADDPRCRLRQCEGRRSDDGSR